MSVFVLSLAGPSSLVFSPAGAHDWSLFLHTSSTSSNSPTVPPIPTDSRMVKLKQALILSVVVSLLWPTMSLCTLMQWVARLQVRLPPLMCDLWLAHLGLGLLVLPTYCRPQGQDTTYTTLTAVQLIGWGIEKPLPDSRVEEEMKEQKLASLHTLQVQPGDLWKPLGSEGGLGVENGLLDMMEDKGGSFLCVVIRDSLGKIMEETGQLPMMS